MFGSVTEAIGRCYKVQDGTRVQVVGVVEDGKYLSLTEELEPAVFLSFQQLPTTLSYLVVRSNRNSQELTAAIRMGLGWVIEYYNQVRSRVRGIKMEENRCAVVGRGCFSMRIKR